MLERLLFVAYLGKSIKGLGIIGAFRSIRKGGELSRSAQSESCVGLGNVLYI